MTEYLNIIYEKEKNNIILLLILMATLRYDPFEFQGRIR